MFFVYFFARRRRRAKKWPCVSRAAPAAQAGYFPGMSTAQDGGECFLFMISRASECARNHGLCRIKMEIY
jgi:hypothetical protein